MRVSFNTPNDTEDTPATATTAEFIREHVKDKYSCAMELQVEQSNAKFHINHHVLLVRQSVLLEESVFNNLHISTLSLSEKKQTFT